MEFEGCVTKSFYYEITANDEEAALDKLHEMYGDLDCYYDESIDFEVYEAD